MYLWVISFETQCTLRAPFVLEMNEELCVSWDPRVVRVESVSDGEVSRGREVTKIL